MWATIEKVLLLLVHDSILADANQLQGESYPSEETWRLRQEDTGV